MELAAAGLKQQPFRTHGRPLHFVSYQAQADAVEFLRTTYEHAQGLGIFQGPSLSGKTTILRHYVESMAPDADVALVDGHQVEPKLLLERVLRQYGFTVKLDSVNESLSMLRVFAQQKAASHHAPLLIVENTHDLNPEALQLLCQLAELKVGEISALRMILSSDRCIAPIVEAPAMECIGQRMTGIFNLCPLEDYETLSYLHAKLHAGGCETPASVLPEKVCATVHTASGGWPGIVDRLVLLALARADSCPLKHRHIEQPTIPAPTGQAGLQSVNNGDAPDPSARLYLTYNGRTIKEIPFDRPRIMVGRSEHNDLPIVSRFVSRHHAVFIREGDTTVLMDLNSTNGTFVNSKRVSNHVMRHEDVVMLGHHGLKFVDGGARERRTLAGDSFSETIIMKSLDDLRNLLARDNTQIVKAPKIEKTADKAS